jgi:hypothetical protein
MKTIEGLSHNFSSRGDIIKAINMLISQHNEIATPRVLVCPHCGSNRWESAYRSTLMRGPTNYFTYRCRECGEETRVKRLKRVDPHIYLGPEDEIVEKK